MNPVKERRLRLAIAHYRNPNVSDDDFFRWVSEDHCARAAGIHARHGVEGFGMLINPKPTREAALKLNELVGKQWVIDDHDVEVQFYLRDFEAVSKLLADPEFAIIQAEETSWIDTERAGVASLTWVEVYVKDGRVVNLGPDGKPEYSNVDFDSVIQLPG